VHGTPFGRYRLIELLGRGGMGEVWRAHDTDTDRKVAIKVLPANLSEDDEFQRRFRREAHAAARLNSPHVIPIHHYGEIDGRLYVDMRLVEGRDLAAVLADGPLDPARAVRIIEQVAKALHAAHNVGLLHRDIKPSNIVLDEDDFAYLIDFGIARTLNDTRMTKTGNTIGTFAYIAPERLRTGTEDARADIYSLACVLYECLTGHPPFPGDTMGPLINAHLNTPPPRPSINQTNVPPAVDEVIATGMAKDPDNRYATTVELANAAHDAITAPIKRPIPRATRLRATEPTPGPTLLDDAGQPPGTRQRRKPATAPVNDTSPPPSPTVRPRPPVHSAPPVRPSGPPPSAPRPSVPPSRPTSSNILRWAGLGVAALAVIVLGAVAAGLLQNNRGAPSSNPTAQSAPASVPTGQPAPSSAPPAATPRYFKTQIGRVCEVTPQLVTCQSCVPGDALPGRETCSDATPGIAFNAAGMQENPVIIGSSSDVKQLSAGQTEHANGWTIASDGAWTRFVNDATGHGMALAAMNHYQI
jgi:serine/threonine protein kinase, bacterial